MTEKHPLQIDALSGWKRTHDCGCLRKEDAGLEVILMGWVNGRRDLGNLIFIDLRDRGGLTQVVFDPEVDPRSHEKAHILRNEWVVAVKGRVSPRLEGRENRDLPTGEIEIKALELRILNHTDTPPFQVDGMVDASEALRMKYRYLELRRPQVLENFRKRHHIATVVRSTLNSKGFLEVETPFLTRSTPEGARDYVVPSRVNPGMFYALPQSPQLFKQLLMVAGFDRYYQIVRCFRDEDLRADRQPEFTQVDMEMSFADEEGVMQVIEDLMKALFHEVLGRPMPAPIPRITYHEAMERYGTDRPDLRFGMEMEDISELAARSDFRIFRGTVEEGGVVKALTVHGGAGEFSRKGIDELAATTSEGGARGLAWAKVTEGGWQSSLDKFFDGSLKARVNERLGAAPGDLLLMVADKRPTANRSLGLLRLEIARRLKLYEADQFALAWITRFPLFEWDEEQDRLVSVHHPFTSPMEEDMDLLESNPEGVRSRAYDLVLNGAEIGGGSVRIHTLPMQARIFRILGISEEEAGVKFGFFLEALKYGAPPHAGMALGFDRLVAILAGVSSIREVIAFPKTTSASCPLTEAPAPLDEAQLRELGLKPIR
ncbi:MAG: aspartate--tRNA ligase [Deltaproteobacteria bacterium]|nr:aspartate--tRNA ligase [Deltaproteobacteria bacterium]MBW1948148.1 aspartate--tRNA ligase [Deltaproteobacteria bacterium]MBW2009455.1 aspartate--tRNA ligase [Deltaproteobacteria bacterium]